MDILKASLEWVRAELFSTPFFILFGLGFIAASLGFWQLGKTDIAKAYIIPTLVAGTLLMIIGFGLFFTNKSRMTKFETAYQTDSEVFISSELQRAESTLKEYRTVVFTAIPLILIVCALVIMFVSAPAWRASAITLIAMLVVILLIDGTAYARMDAYHKKLVTIENELKN